MRSAALRRQAKFPVTASDQLGSSDGGGFGHAGETGREHAVGEEFAVRHEYFSPSVGAILQATVIGPPTFVGDPGEMGKGIRAESGGRSCARRDHHKGWYQTNANQSLFPLTRPVSGRKKLTPLGQSGGMVRLEIVPAAEGALRVEMVVDGRMDCDEFLQ